MLNRINSAYAVVFRGCRHYALRERTPGETVEMGDTFPGVSTSNQYAFRSTEQTRSEETTWAKALVCWS
jgi:hypothetical protein